MIVASVGFGLESLGRFNESLAWYKRAVEVDPDFAVGYRAIGAYHYRVSGQLDEAVVWYGKSFSLEPGTPDSLAFVSALFLNLGEPDKAEYWAHRSIELGPEDFSANVSMQFLSRYKGDEAGVLEYGRKASATFQSLGFGQWDRVGLLRDHELRAGRFREARALYEKAYPELLNESAPKVDHGDCPAAINLALVLSKTGEPVRADQLLNRSFERIQTISRLGWYGYGIADVQIYALRGEKQKALSALRQAIDDGWRLRWWYYLKHDPNLESLHDEPEFQAMVAEIEADMAAQLARVREMERNGELEPIPEVSATTQ